MEESIKRVEELVHATNSALAQMKFSLMLDDMSEGKYGTPLRLEDFDRMFLNEFLDKDGLKQCRDEFQTETSEILAKVEKMFNSNESKRKNSKVLDRIKEINKKKNNTKSEQSKPEGTEQSRQKLLSLISEEKFSPGVSSSKESVGSKQIVPFDREKEKPHPGPGKFDSLLSITKTPIKAKVELKKKILETQEIVDRGFLTARQLAQKVGCIAKCDKKEKTPRTEKIINEDNFRSSGSKTESNEIRTFKCNRHSKEKKNKEKLVQEIERVNAQVVDVKRKELRRRLCSNLQVQRLPNVHIKGGLKLQKIHNLEISTAEETVGEKSNTAIIFLTHERIEREKMKKIIGRIRRENCYCIEENILRNYVECFNCGKLLRIRKAWADPQKIDEILYECNFNVFDPRIDEFVEKFGTADFENLGEKTRLGKPLVHPLDCVPDKHEVKLKDFNEKVELKNKTEESKKSKHITLREFSNELLKKYRQEVETLEDKHIKLDNLLKNLFRKVDESREVFEDCHFLKNLKFGAERIRNLTVTTPVLVSLGGNSFKNRKKQKNADKKCLKEVNKIKIKSLEKKTEDKKPRAPSTSSQSPEINEHTREGLSFVRFIQEGNVKGNAKEWQKKFSISSNLRSEKPEHQDGIQEDDDKSSLALTKKHSSNKSERAIKGKHIEKTLIVESIPRKSRKSLDLVFSKDETLNKSFVATSGGEGETTKLSETTEGKVEEEKTSSVTTSISSNTSRRICFGDSRENEVEDPKTLTAISVKSKTVKALLRKEEVQKEFVVTSSKDKIHIDAEETAEIFEVSLEKSENNYESDFESFTNVPEGKEDDCEEEESEIIKCVKKLSIISEVDSEVEKKISEEQKTAGSANRELKDTSKMLETAMNNFMPQKTNVDLLNSKKDDSVVSEISYKSKKESEAPLKSISTELMTSLKDILFALQDQFARTESLADKLIENVKTEEKENNLDLTSVENLVISPWKMPAPSKMVENLQSARKDWNCPPIPSLPLFSREKLADRDNEKLEHLPTDSLSNEGGSSIGEIIVSEGRVGNSGKSQNSSISENSFLNPVTQKNCVAGFARSWRSEQ